MMFRWFEQRRHFTLLGTVAIMAVMSLYMNLSLHSTIICPTTASRSNDEELFTPLFSRRNFKEDRRHHGRKNTASHTPTSKEGFGACLFILDDNHRLSEWLAYHYHVLPLNYLVVGVDPNSETSPTSLLNSWRRRHSKEDIEIVEWNTTQIYQGEVDDYQERQRRNNHHPSNNNKRTPQNSIALFYQMQNMFLRNCLLHMKQENKTWVTVIDSDEFIHFNGQEGEISQMDHGNLNPEDDTTTTTTQNESSSSSSSPNLKDSLYRMVVPGISYPSIQEKGSIYKFLKFLERQPQPSLPLNHPLWNLYQAERGNHGNATSTATTVFVPPCISIPRLLFGAIESTHDERHKMVPKSPLSSSSSSSSPSFYTSFNPSLFSTLRFRKHMTKSIAATERINGWAKVIIDVSRIPWEDFPTLQNAWDLDGLSINVHRPIPKHCALPYFMDGGAASLFRINHYVGSWEAYNYRLDARTNSDSDNNNNNNSDSGRNKATWEEKAMIQDETDDTIVPWLQGLVQEEGFERAEEMLLMAGHFTPKEPVLPPPTLDQEKEVMEPLEEKAEG
jgi:hypothetical protein